MCNEFFIHLQCLSVENLECDNSHHKDKTKNTHEMHESL